MAFKKAEKRNSKLRLALSGVSGAGKTYSALLLAKEFGSKIAVMDSEKGSASLYADLVPFDVEELEEHSIQTYLEKISEAAAAGYDVLIIDSFSHSWMSALEAVDRAGGWTKAGKTISPLVARLVTAILSYPGHVIATMRSKTEYAFEQNEKGKTGMRKVGLAPVARPDSEYDWTIWLEILRDGGITVSKTRCSALSEPVYSRDTDIPKIAKTIKAWLASGAESSPADVMIERVKFAKDQEALRLLVPEIKALGNPPQVIGAYRVRAAEFQGVTP